MKKIRARQLILKRYSCYGLKKIHAINLITKKKFLRLENSPPPHNFSNHGSVPYLIFFGEGGRRIRTENSGGRLESVGQCQLESISIFSLFFSSMKTSQFRKETIDEQQLQEFRKQHKYQVMFIWIFCVLRWGSFNSRSIGATTFFFQFLYMY